MLEKEIYDIFPLEQISFFPLAIGYKILLYVLFVILLLFLFYNFFLKKSWKFSFNNELTNLLREDKIDGKLVYFFLKKILLHKFERKQIAHLTDEELLSFLDRKTKGFSWRKEAGFLLEVFQKKEVF